MTHAYDAPARKAGASAKPSRAKRPAWQKPLFWLGEFVLYLVIAMLVVTLMRLFLIQPFLVPSSSMEETLQKDDRILAFKPGQPERGMIVVFRDDLHWLPPLPEKPPAWKEALAWVKLLPPQDEQYLVKRLIGLPGDHVTCCDAQQRVSVNGQVLDESEYLYLSNPAMPQIPFDVVVPEGRMFVMGDHRDGSQDSRYWMCSGMLTGPPTPDITFPSLDSIQGKVVGIMMPFSRIQGFGIPDDFASVPEPTASPPDSSSDLTWTCPGRQSETKVP